MQRHRPAVRRRKLRDAVAANEAVAETAATVDAPVNVVQTCLQARGSIGEGSLDNDGNEDASVARDETEAKSSGLEDTDHGAVKNDETSAAQEQYDGSRTSDGQEDSDDSCAVALDPSVTVSESGSGEETLNVESGEEGKYRVSYDVEDDASINISLPSSNSSGDAMGGFPVQGDGSRIVELSEGSYIVTIEPTPPTAEYTVEVGRCGASSDDPDNAMDDTFDDGKQLANTGGPTETGAFVPASAVLIPAGAALMVSALIAAAWLRNASNRS